MENLIDILSAVPVIFSYFIPGYVYLWMRKQINNRKKHDGIELLLLCIVITFILNLITEGIFNICGLTDFMGRKIGIAGSYTCGNLISVLFAVICGYLSCQLKNNKIVLWFKRKLKISGSAHATVWSAALTEQSWVTVYLDHPNICYVGRVSYILTDPEVDRREMYLTQYKAYDTGNDMHLLVDRSTCIENGIYIDCKNVERIEVQDDGPRADFTI